MARERVEQFKSYATNAAGRQARVARTAVARQTWPIVRYRAPRQLEALVTASRTASSAAGEGDQEHHHEGDGDHDDERYEKPTMLTEVLHHAHLLS